MRLKPVELRKVYIDSLSEWVEVPIFEQEEVIKLVNEIDWEGLDLWQYKKNLIDHWNGLSPSAKTRSKNPVVRDELYEALLHENWGLAPGNALDLSLFYTNTEAANVQMWFASGKTKGRPPDVINA